jgi:hypothetical protein
MKSASGRAQLIWRLAAMGVVFLAVAGCSGRPRNVARKVTGKVTLGGQPLAGALVTFTPLEGGSPSSGRTDQEGKYTLYWARVGRRQIEGAQIGEQAVKISTIVEAAPSAKPPVAGAPEKVPYKYRTETPLKATVKSGANEINFDLEPGPVEPPQPKGKTRGKGK